MRLRCFLITAICLLLVSCAKPERDNIHGNAIVDWVDFVMLNGHFYTGLYESVIADPEVVTDKTIGRTTFKLADVVTNPGYKTRDGDAAFLPIGTELYQIKGFEPDELIAALNPERIGGYSLYAELEFAKTVQRHYAEVPKDRTVRVELYKGQETSPYRTLRDNEKERFIQMLDAGQDVENYLPQSRDSDPAYYQMVFYTDGPIAYSFSLMDDDAHVYFHPDAARLLDPAIRTLLQP